MLIVGYALLELALLVLAAPILLAEVALLLSLAWPLPVARGLRRAARDTVPPVIRGE